MQYGIGLDKLKFARDDLLLKVKANREKHIKTHSIALCEYRKDLITYLQEKLEDAKNEKDIKHQIDLIRPVEYTKHYDRAIAMLEMTTNTEIELEQVNFAQLVLDEWTWSESFVHSTSGYLDKLKIF